MFDLEKVISKWKKTLRKNPALEDGHIEELESHLRDLIDEHLEQGISPEGSFNYAVEQLGDSYELGNQFYKTYTTKFSGRPSWQAPVWMPSLLWNYIKIALRNIKRHKSYSLINIFGFSIALVPAVLTLLYVDYEFSYDKHNENFDRIYRVVADKRNGTVMPLPLADALKSDAPEVEESTRMIGGQTETITYNNKDIRQEKVLWSDPQILNIFSFEFLRGNPETAFDDKYSVVISEKTAEKFFRDKDPLGKTLLLRHMYNLKVTGVYKNLPRTSHFDADMIIQIPLMYGRKALGGNVISDQSWGISMYPVYVLLNENTDPAVLENKIHPIIEKHAGKDSYSHLDFYLQPLGDIHLKSHFLVEHKPGADIIQILILLFMALIILIIAVINYVNLSTARMTKRIKEIGVRKIIGARKAQLMRQMFTETIVITSLSFLATLLAVSFILPYFSEFIGINLHFNLIQNFNLILGILTLIIMVSVTAGVYPALILSSIKPLSFFSGTFISRRKPLFRSILVVIQFVITIALIILTSVINKQLDFIANKDLGYSIENTVHVRLSRDLTNNKCKVIKNELVKNPNITGVAFSSATPLTNLYRYSPFAWQGKPEDKRVQVNYYSVDYEFLDLYDFKIIEGRKFSEQFKSDETENIIINETALKETGWKNPIGKIVRHNNRNGWSDKYVIGVVKDFQFKSLHSKVPPFYFVMDSTMTRNELSVKVKPDTEAEVIAFLDKEIKEFQPGNEFIYSFLGDRVETLYRTEYKMQTVFTIFSVFTILISCLGLFGLVSFTTEARQKEIGIRKVLGASSMQIGLKILREMMILIVIASIIAAPLAYMGAEKWLEDFEYKTNIGLGVFILSGLMVYSLSIAAMILQVRRASTQNPVDTLKYE